MLVGTDKNGNRYYRIGDSRRVEYRNNADPANIDANWYLWLHGVVDAVESAEQSSTSKSKFEEGFDCKKEVKNFSVLEYTSWKPKDGK